MTGRPSVYIHTNRKQMIGALVSQYSMKRNSRHPDEFDVRILVAEDHDFLNDRDGQAYLRDGMRRRWRMDDLQSFTPLRFMPPAEMGYEGRSLVVDPDVFAVGDVWELLTRDMSSKAILCRRRSASASRSLRHASSVMLLDCGRLTHWDAREGFDAMFRMERDYTDWICLLLEPPESIDLLEEEWNDFDRLGDRTRLLHNTTRETQPWKTGLPVDFSVSRPPFRPTDPRTWRRWLGSRLRPKRPKLTHYLPHPDPRQEQFFFGLLRECVDAGIVTEEMMREEMRRNHLRHDALELLGHVSAHG